jgi:hypothetical protein
MWWRIGIGVVVGFVILYLILFWGIIPGIKLYNRGSAWDGGCGQGCKGSALILYCKQVDWTKVCTNLCIGQVIQSCPPPAFE